MRFCEKCGGPNGMQLEDREGNVVKLIPKCYACFWEDAYKYVPITSQIILTEAPETDLKIIMENSEKTIIDNLSSL